MDTFIKLENLKKIYKKDTVALDIEQLFLQKDGLVFITGPSGAGKTTLLNMIGLLDKPTSGKIFINGEDSAQFSDDKKAHLRREFFGFIFQDYNLIPTLTVWGNIILALMPQATEDKTNLKKLESFLARVGLENKRNRLPKELSGGEQQRVAIIRCLANNPKVILADEPSSNLDPENTKLIFDLLYAIMEEQKLLLVVAQTRLEQVSRSFREVRLSKGKIV